MHLFTWLKYLQIQKYRCAGAGGRSRSGRRRVPAALAEVSRVIAEARGTAADPRRARVRPRWACGGQDQLLGRVWDGDEAAAAGWITSGEGFLGVWEMMTSAAASTARRGTCCAHDRARGTCGRGRAGNVPLGITDGPAAL